MRDTLFGTREVRSYVEVGTRTLFQVKGQGMREKPVYTKRSMKKVYVQAVAFGHEHPSPVMDAAHHA